MTEKLYYGDAYLAEFCARVISCEADGDRFAVVLDRTAFYPEGGGQRADGGVIGGARVLDVQKRGGEVIHILDGEVSGEVKCAVDFAPRYRMMQNHTAEHILCGAFHRMIGAENVGFHMGSKDVTFDLDREPSEDIIAQAEYEANEAVFRNMEVRSFFPSDGELSRLTFRSKGEFAEGAAIRIVEVGDADRCACSALHVRRTGEIGRIKLISHARYKGGMRFHMLAGYDALEYDLAEHAAVSDVARRLSAKPEELSDAVALLEAKIAADKESRRRLIARYADALVSLASCGGEGSEVAATIGNTALIASDVLAADEARETANLAAVKFRHAVVVGAAGNFVITAGEGGDAKALFSALRERIAISGGGKSDMVSGRLSADVPALAEALAEIANEG